MKSRFIIIILTIFIFSNHGLLLRLSSAFKNGLIAEQTTFSRSIITNDFNGSLGFEVKDFDQDGDLDILGAAHTLNQLAWWENDQMGFKKHLVADGFTGAADIISFDLDNDGDQDIAGVAHVQNEFALWENNEFEFTKHVIKNNYNGAFSVNGIDIDGDQDIDLLTTSQGGNEITLWNNEGNLVFTELIISDNFPDPSFTFLTDIDNDSDIDIIVTSIQGGKISIWKNDVINNFTEINIISNYYKAHSGAPFDIDSDNDLDIVSVSLSGSIDWLENNGTDIFFRHTINNNFSMAVDAKAGDFNNDDLIDFVGVAQGSEKIGLLQNEGNQIFVEQIISLEYRGSRCQVIDFDQDNDLDILTSSHYLGDISLWTNNLLTKANNQSSSEILTNTINQSSSETIPGFSIFALNIWLLTLYIKKKKKF